MKTYIVGGAVRDELLGLPVKDRDWVVVGATPQTLLDLGYKPVGKDFPVFLHPRTREEYALARTERKVGRGYTGFTFHADPNVTLEQDLARRDLTINAIARAESGELIDPFNGYADLRARMLRHVSLAFIEDPVRILRLARFAARFDFAVAPETMTLMREMVSNGEVDALVPERVWQEFAKGLMEARPSLMFGVLRECGALAKLLPELDRLFENTRSEPGGDRSRGETVMQLLDCAAEQGLSLAVRWAVLVHQAGRDASDAPIVERAERELRVEKVTALCERLRVPAYCRDLARLTTALQEDVNRAPQLSAARILRLLQRCDAFRKPDRFNEFLQACAVVARGCSGCDHDAYPQADYLQAALASAVSVNSGAIAVRATDKAKIPLMIARERLSRLRELKTQWNAV